MFCSFLSLKATNSANSFLSTNSPADMAPSASIGGLMLWSALAILVCSLNLYFVWQSARDTLLISRDLPSGRTNRWVGVVERAIKRTSLLNSSRLAKHPSLHWNVTFSRPSLRCCSADILENTIVVHFYYVASTAKDSSPMLQSIAICRAKIPFDRLELSSQFTGRLIRSSKEKRAQAKMEWSADTRCHPSHYHRTTKSQRR